MIAGMSDTTERAKALAAAHPIGEVLENAFLGFFAVIGGAIGYVFRVVNFLLFHGYTVLFIVWLAFKDGFKNTAGLRVPAREVDPQPAAPPLLADPRYQDPNSTPFGVPYGPNVHASHD